MDYRTEKDSFGDMKVPSDKYYGAQTARSLINFNIGIEVFPPVFVKALGIIKKACALTNKDFSVIEKGKADIIAQAAQEVVDGKLNDNFLVSIWQTGSGTQVNMNANEVISNRAIELLGGEMGSKTPIHPNDDVNKSQSSNDVIPTAMNISSVEAIDTRLIPALRKLLTAFEKKSQEFGDITKIGRTHMMDATPLTLGQEFSGYTAQLSSGLARIEKTLPSLQKLALGGTAVGTGVNAPKDFDKKVAKKISELTGNPFVSADNKFEALASHDCLVEASSALKCLAVSLMKIANDIRFLGSGPRCGIGELILPANEPGSSIMPGKVNPTQCEALTMVCSQVIGNDLTITVAAASGNLELNVFKPVIIYNLLQSIVLLADSMNNFCDKCIVDIQPNIKKIKENLEKSLMLVTLLVPKLGYDKCTEIAKKAYDDDITLKEAVISLNCLSEKEFDGIIKL